MNKQEQVENEMTELTERIDALLVGSNLQAVIPALMALLAQSFVELMDHEGRETIRDEFERIVIGMLRKGLEHEMDEQGIES